ncbi:MAG: TetR/AcrR family transcriptional regulator [Pseudomonadota bacterium]
METDTKTALMDFAEHSVRARGFDGFSYADLAEAVGIRKASIHYHFPTKASLSEALMERYHKALQSACAGIDAKYERASDRLAAMLDYYRNALKGGQTLCLCVAFIGSQESLSEDLNSKILAFREMILDWLTQTYARGRQDHSIASVTAPDQEARSTLALLEGAQLAARAARDVQIFDQATELLRLRLHGSLPGGSKQG